jgi:hypothetical protein
VGCSSSGDCSLSARHGCPSPSWCPCGPHAIFCDTNIPPLSYSHYRPLPRSLPRLGAVQDRDQGSGKLFVFLNGADPGVSLHIFCPARSGGLGGLGWGSENVNVGTMGPGALYLVQDEVGIGIAGLHSDIHRPACVQENRRRGSRLVVTSAFRSVFSVRCLPWGRWGYFSLFGTTDLWCRLSMSASLASASPACSPATYSPPQSTAVSAPEPEGGGQ